MKSCLIATHTTQMAGAERVIAAILDEADRTGVKSDLATLKHPSIGRLGKGRHVKGVLKILFGRYDVFHSHLFLPGVLLRLRRVYDRDMNWIHTVHYASYEGQSWQGLKNWLDRRFVFPAVDRLIAVSPSVFLSIAEFKNSTTIENSVTFSTSFRQPQSSSDEIIIGAMSMLRPEKGIDDLIYAFEKVNRRNEAAGPSLKKCLKLKIAGDGPEMIRLTKLVDSLNLRNQVELLGYINCPEDFLSAIDIFVNCSHTESYGLAIAEAMQFSLPIVASDVGNTASLLGSGEFGRLVKRGPGFVDRLVAAIGETMSDLPDSRLRSSRGHQRYLQTAAPVSVMTTAYLDLYKYFMRPGVCMVSAIVTQATGGIQKQMLLQSRELYKRGYRVFVLQRLDALLSEETRKSWSHAEFISTPNPFPRLWENSRLAQRVRGILFTVMGVWAISGKKRSIQIIHAHQLYSPTLIGFFCKKFFGMNVVVKVTASGELGEYRQLQSLSFFRLRKLAFKSIDRVIVLTDEMRTEVQQLGFRDEQIILIPNSVETQSPVKNANFSKRLSKRLEILYCGRLSSEKSLETLIKAGRKFAEQGGSCRIRLVGGSHGGRDVTAQLKELSQSPPSGLVIEFLGHQSDVRPFYEESDIFVLPSISEGMSNSLLEALAHGLICICSDIPANRFVIENGENGLLFQCGDADDLCAKLITVANDLCERAELYKKLSTGAQRTVINRFSTQSVGKRIADIYHSLDTRRPQSQDPELGL